MSGEQQPDLRKLACESLGRSLGLLAQLQHQQMYAGAAMNAGFIQVVATRAPSRPKFACVSIALSGRYSQADIDQLKQFIEGLDQDVSVGCETMTLSDRQDGEVSS